MNALARWSLYIGSGTVALSAVLLLGGFIYEKVGEAHDAQNYPAPGAKINIRGSKLHILCKGERSPTVIIETGMAVPSCDWFPIQQEIAKFARVCTYDRAGYGWSESSRYPLSLADHANELNKLLIKAEAPAPYVMVGHSYGGALVRLFTHAHPDQVAGMVLVESMEEQYAFSPDLQAVMQAQEGTTKREELSAYFGLMRFQLRDDPIDIAFASHPSYYREWLREEDSILTAPSELRHPGGFGTLGNIPLIVIKRGLKVPQSMLVGTGLSVSDVERRWTEAQKRLTTISADSDLIVATKSHHNVNYDQPDLVVDAVKRVVAAVRNHALLDKP